MAATTIRTVRRPRTKVCRARLAKTRRTPGIIATARAPAESSARAARALRARSRRPTVGTWRRATLATLMRSMATTATRAPAGPVTTRRMLARAGPMNVPSPSAAPDVTFAPISAAASARRRAAGPYGAAE